ncbi:hypothetical protein K474DRAFT_1708766 [Panus rudis PR-1116 ss-1]|nr:hypothetical protein K474DRAFT_1708766 [Panus rudis PR-1116 ss-1]
MTTHVNTSWKIEEVKLWLLSKFLPTTFTSVPYFPRGKAKSSGKRRTISPIRFASRQQLQFKAARVPNEYYQEEDYDLDDEDVDDEDLLEAHKFTASRPSVSSSQQLLPKQSALENPGGKDSPVPDPASYILIAYSTGQLLQDRHSLSMYSIQPHELLELHRAPYVAKLSRQAPDQYVLPYFEARVRAPRISSLRDAHTELDSLGKRPDADTKAGDGEDKTGEYNKIKPPRKRRSRPEWRERWIIIHQGFLKICRQRNDPKPTYESPLSSLLDIRGSAPGSGTSPNSQTNPSQSTLSPPAGATISPTDQEYEFVEKVDTVLWLRFRCGPSKPSRVLPGMRDAWFRKSYRDVSASIGGGEGIRIARSVPSFDGLDFDAINVSEEKAGDTEGPHDDSVWVVIDMIEESAMQNLLRLLHREAPMSTPSTFFDNIVHESYESPPPSPILFAATLQRGESPPTPSSAKSFGTPPPPSTAPSEVGPSPKPYPEWRLSVLDRARQAGLGDVGRAMQWAMFGGGGKDEEDESTIDQQTISRGRSKTKQKFESVHEHKKAVYQQGVIVDDSESSDEESASELEWEGWREEIIQRRRNDSNRARDDNSVIEWESNWNWVSNLADQGDSGSHTQESGPNSPRADAINLDSVDAILASQPHQLNSYSSADSLLRRTIKRTGSKASHPRSGSPSTGITRVRPRSPLAAGLEEEEQDEGDDIRSVDDDDDNTGVTSTFVSDPSNSQRHALRAQHSESALSSPYFRNTAPRMPMPMSMAMSQITSTVSVGTRPDTAQSLSGNDKDRKRGSFMPQPGRGTRDKSSMNRSKRDEETASALQGLFRPTKLKLSLPFSQSNQAGPSRQPGASPVTPDSWESPKFASPDDSSDF